MLALTTVNALTLIDSTTLKSAPSSVPSCQTLLSRPTASCWSPDNTSLFIASSADILKYDLLSNSFHNLHSLTKGNTIPHLAAKDKGDTLVFSDSRVTQVFDCISGKITLSMAWHKSSITSLALSNDSTLLATTSAGGAHVDNLTNGSHTVLRGLPLPNATINTCVFHTHFRTRLLLGVGRQLIVYDTTRPSGPMKTIGMTDGTAGEIKYVACSPFSKTLVAFATSAGTVFLVDLEKEKAIFRTLQIKIPITCLAFSQEGGGLYLGTENGKLLIVDLRALDKPPKTIVISDIGARIENMCVQKKFKATSEPSTQATSAAAAKSSTKPDPISRPLSTASRKPVTTTSVVKPVPKTTTTRNVTPPSATTKNGAAVMRTSSEGSRKSNPSPKNKEKPNKEVLVPVKDPPGDIGSCVKEKSSDEDTGKKEAVLDTLGQVSPSPKSPILATRSSTLEGPDGPRRDLVGFASARTNITTSLVSTQPLKTGAGSRPDSRTDSSHSRPGSSRSHQGLIHPQQPNIPLDSGLQVKRKGSANGINGSPRKKQRGVTSRTPSPGVQNIDMDVGMNAGPSTPVVGKNKRSGMSVLGLGTPEVNQWITSGQRSGREPPEGKGKVAGKTVGFGGDHQNRGKAHRREDTENFKGDARGRGEKQALQISSQNPCPSTLSSSPLRQSTFAHPNVNSQNNLISSSDHLRTIIRDVMYDFQRETKAEMTGLHLDLVRMGRGWRQEVRSVMDEYIGNLRELAEENARLKEENARLRRGY